MNFIISLSGQYISEKQELQWRYHISACKTKESDGVRDKQKEVKRKWSTIIKVKQKIGEKLVYRILMEDSCTDKSFRDNSKSSIVD